MLFKRARRQITQCRMGPKGVVSAYGLVEFLYQFTEVSDFAMNQILVLDRSVHPFNVGVFIDLVAHADADVGPLKQAHIVIADVLSPPVGVVDEPVAKIGRLSSPKGHPQRLDIVSGPHIVGHRMTDDPPGIHIHDQDNVEKLTVEIKIRYVARPELVDAVQHLVGQQIAVATVRAGKRSPGLITEQFSPESVPQADTDEGIAPHGFGFVELVHRPQAHPRVYLAHLQHQAHDHALPLLAGALTLQGLVVCLLADDTM